MKKVTKITVLVIIVLLMATTAFAKTKSVKIDSVYKPGDITVSASVGFGYGFSLAVYPGAELFLAQTRIADVLPLDFGVAARGFFSSYSTSSYGYEWGWTAFGAGVFGTAHLSFREFDIPFKYLDNMDFYIGLGVKFDSFIYTGDSYYWSDYGGFNFASIAGVNYFFNDHLAIVLEGTYWGGGGGTIGLLYKL